MRHTEVISLYNLHPFWKLYLEMNTCLITCFLHTTLSLFWKAANTNMIWYCHYWICKLCLSMIANGKLISQTRSGDMKCSQYLNRSALCAAISLWQLAEALKNLGVCGWTGQGIHTCMCKTGWCIACALHLEGRETSLPAHNNTGSHVFWADLLKVLHTYWHKGHRNLSGPVTSNLAGRSRMEIMMLSPTPFLKVSTFS